MVSMRLMMIMLLSVVVHVKAADDEQKKLHRELRCKIYKQDSSLEEIQGLAKDIADIDAKDTLKETALHKACRHNRLDTAKALLQYSANSKVENKCGETPLDIARRHGHQEIVNLIKEHEAILNNNEPKGN